MDINIYDNDNPIIFDPLEQFIQEIAISLKTGLYEIYGLKDYIDIERFIFNQFVTKTQIKNDISNFINNNCSQAENFTYDIFVNFIDNMILIEFQIHLDNSGTNVTRQKFLFGINGLQASA